MRSGLKNLFYFIIYFFFFFLVFVLGQTFYAFTRSNVFKSTFLDLCVQVCVCVARDESSAGCVFLHKNPQLGTQCTNKSWSCKDMKLNCEKLCSKQYFHIRKRERLEKASRQKPLNAVEFLFQKNKNFHKAFLSRLLHFFSSNSSPSNPTTKRFNFGIEANH